MLIPPVAAEICVLPPSITKSPPSAYGASLDAKNSAALTTSLGAAYAIHRRLVIARPRREANKLVR